jgi:hypothetical protein
VTGSGPGGGSAAALVVRAEQRHLGNPAEGQRTFVLIDPDLGSTMMRVTSPGRGKAQSPPTVKRTRGGWHPATCSVSKLDADVIDAESAVREHVHVRDDPVGWRVGPHHDVGAHPDRRSKAGWRARGA